MSLTKLAVHLKVKHMAGKHPQKTHAGSKGGGSTTAGKDMSLDDRDAPILDKHFGADYAIMPEYQGKWSRSYIKGGYLEAKVDPTNRETLAVVRESDGKQLGIVSSRPDYDADAELPVIAMASTPQGQMRQFASSGQAYKWLSELSV